MAFRRLWPDDAERLAAHFRRLDAESRRFRFGRPVSDAFLERYCAETDWLRAILLGYVVDGELRGLGELRRLPGLAQRTGEFAVTVEPPWRNRGIGSALLRRLVTLARHRGVDTVYMLCLADNRPMQRLAGKLEADVSWSWGQAEARLQIGAPSLASHFSESFDAVALALEAATERASPAPRRSA